MEEKTDPTSNGHKTEQEYNNSTGETMKLHWDPKIPRRGLGDLIRKANHIALTVSDVGRSLWFYTEILGLQQIKRPNFDRHGGWLTMGNIELHLILGQPIVPSGKDLIVSHISLESDNIREVLNRLQEMEVPFETNVSVPQGDYQKGVVTQFFFRDPDGYYIELCNCDILTEYCLGESETALEGYSEGVGCDTGLVVSITKLLSLKNKAINSMVRDEDAQIIEEFEKTDGSKVEVDQNKYDNLVKRMKVYGDVVQGETKESLYEALQKANNNVPHLIKYLIAKHRGQRVYQPPTIYKNNEEMYVPPPLSIDKK